MLESAHGFKEEHELLPTSGSGRFTQLTIREIEIIFSSKRGWFLVLVIRTLSEILTRHEALSVTKIWLESIGNSSLYFLVSETLNPGYRGIFFFQVIILKWVHDEKIKTHYRIAYLLPCFDFSKFDLSLCCYPFESLRVFGFRRTRTQTTVATITTQTKYVSNSAHRKSEK